MVTPTLLLKDAKASRLERPRGDRHGTRMTNEEKAVVDALCKRIVEEQHPELFTKLVAQLNDLLELKQQKLEADSS
jgi:hypothetical protein